jgi:hypothetical protein
MTPQARGAPSRPGHRLVRRAALALVLALAVGGCGQASAPTSTSSAPPSRGGLTTRPFDGPHVTITATGAYLAWFESPPTKGVRTELARINLASGQIEATRQLGAVYFDQAVTVGDSLWVATSSPAGESLVRLNPQTLAPAGHMPIGGGGNQGLAGPSLAFAGGWLWVGASDRLLRSSPDGRLTATVSLQGAVTSSVGANSSGTMLIVGEAGKNGAGALERRDPATGALLSSRPMIGIVAPAVGGVADSGIWASEVTGMLGYVERYDAKTLGPTPGTRFAGANGITVEVANGLAWVYPSSGGPGPSLCADPSSGRVLARLDLPQQDHVLAIGPRQLVYAEPVPNGSNYYVKTEPIPGSCRI